MKQAVLTILFGIFFISVVSCKKGNSKQNFDITTSILGSWELRQTSAALNSTVNNYAPGNGNTLKFTNTNYETYSNGILVKSGHYSITLDTTVASNVCLIFSNGQFMNRIIYDTSYNTPKIFMQISNNKLTLISGCYANDAGHSEKYERQ